MMGWIGEGRVGYVVPKLLLQIKELILIHIIYQIWYDRFMHVHCKYITKQAEYLCVRIKFYIV